MVVAVLVAFATVLAAASSVRASTYTITPGGPFVTVTTTAADENATVTFDGTAGRRISLTMSSVTFGTSTCCSTKVSIRTPSGTTLQAAMNVGTAGAFVDVKTLPATGVYTILVDPQGDATGSMNLTLHDVPADTTAATAPGGGPVTVSTTVPGQNARVTFPGTAARRIALRASPASSTIRISILNPSGTTLVAPTSVTTAGGFIDTKTLGSTGTHTIVVDPQSGGTGDVTLTVYDVPPDPGGTIVPNGDPASLTTTTPGQNGRLTFAGTAGRLISVRVPSSSFGTSPGTLYAGLKVSVLNPNGTALLAPTGVGTSGGFLDAKALPTTGTYTILFDPQGEYTGTATALLSEFVDVVAPITPNGPAVTVTTTTPGQNARATFDAVAGDGLSVRVSPSCCSVKVFFVAPDGSKLATLSTSGTTGGTLTTRAVTTGAHSVLVDPTYDTTGSVTLALVRDNTAPAPPALTVAESAAGAFAAGTVLHYRPGSTGSFSVTAVSSDAGTGLQKVNFTGLSGGFTPTTAVDDSTSPYARTYSWGTSATFSSTTNRVTAYDRVGNSSVATFTVVPDSTPPTTTDNAASTGSAWRNTSATVALVPTDGAGSGVAAAHFTTDGTTPTTASPTGTSVVLSADGVHTVRYLSVDNVGNVAAPSTSDTQIRIDRTAPSTATLTTLPSVVRNGQALSGSGSDALSGVASITYLSCPGTACTPSAVIGSSTTAPSYGVTWTAQPADGSHQVLARVTDAAGNTRDSAKQTVTVDNKAPAAPAIGTKPAAVTNATTATFSFSGEAGGRFECRLDTDPYAVCTSPRTYAGPLAAGVHTFEVRQVDTAGNTGPAATYSWTVDLTAPTTTITASPAGPTPSTTASFSFAADETGSTFQCRLDGTTFAACTSPRSYSGLAEGGHVFEVRAVDPAGNVGPAASHSWTVTDTTPPTVTITAAPSSLSASSSASFSFAANEAGSAFECRLDAAPYAACTSPHAYTGLADGGHTVAVRATDAAGNVGPAATRSWTVDTTAPTTTITAGPEGTVTSAGASFSFTADETAGTFECRLDGAAFGPCSSPTSYDGLSDGDHSFDVRAADVAGNLGAPASRSWTVVTVAPGP